MAVDENRKTKIIVLTEQARALQKGLSDLYAEDPSNEMTLEEFDLGKALLDLMTEIRRGEAEPS